MLKKITTMMILGLLATSTANAVWMGDLKVKEIVAFSDGSYNVRFNKKPEDTCNLWGFDFRVDNDKEKVMLKFLTIALMTNQTVHIGYDSSSTPGTNHNSGCTSKTMAKMFQVHLKK